MLKFIGQAGSGPLGFLILDRQPSCSVFWPKGLFWCEYGYCLVEDYRFHFEYDEVGLSVVELNGIPSGIWKLVFTEDTWTGVTDLGL